MKQYAQQYAQQLQDSMYSVHYEVPRNIHENYAHTQALYSQNQPQVYINGISPNRSQRKGQQQVHFQNDPSSSSHYVQPNAQQYSLQDAPYGYDRNQQDRSQRFNNFQQSSRTLPPYVDLSDENPYGEERFGQIYYK